MGHVEACLQPVSTKRCDPTATMEAMFPSPADGTCACGCGKKLEGRRRRWASDACIKPCLIKYLIRRGDSHTIRCALFARDRGICARCGKDAHREEQEMRRERNIYETARNHRWEAHHTFAVADGGGGCDLDGYETLCLDCHKEENKAQRDRSEEAHV